MSYISRTQNSVRKILHLFAVQVQIEMLANSHVLIVDHLAV